MPVVPAVSDSLNPAQEAAVKHHGSPAVVLAGAGSGKTTVLTNRAAWLIETKEVDPATILLVTFTNKAAGEMRQRIGRLTKQPPPFVGTFHSYCARFLRKHAQVMGYEEAFTIYDIDDQLSTLKLVYREHSLDPKQLNYRAVLSQISHAKSELLLPGEYAAQARGYLQEQTAQIYAWYQMKLKAFNAMDFDDLLLYTVSILRQDPTIRELYQQQYHHILVDEYQDTNKVQYELTKLLANPKNNLFVVGDFSQSIYAWRGADYRNMLRLHDDFDSLVEYRLEQNYRSHQSILDAATQVISLNRLHPVLSLWTNQTKTEPLELKATRTDTEEASQVVSWIAKESQQIPLDEMAILYRTNAQSRAFEEQLLAASIPYQVIGGTKFYDRKEIKDVLSYTHLLANPKNEVGLARAQKIGKRRYQAFTNWRDSVQETLNSLAPVEILKGVLEATDYIKKFDQSVPEDVSRLENIAELLRVASRFATLSEFLENVALIQDGYMHSDDNTLENKGVQLMSLHSAKGLEFSVVFLVGFEEGLLPHSRSLMNPEELEEERRLCYVGITRAKQRLYFSYAQSRFAYGTTAKNIPSRFLKDINPELFSSSSTKLTRPSSTQRRVVISDEFLDQILSGDMDVSSLID